jgi:membrane-bound metal-dependent hydrolase YbcI (DUF457 family)
MDNIAHTLVGAALGRAVADRRIPGAALVGAVAGNAPDWAELVLRPRAWAPRSGVEYLVYHRGITHSLAGAAAASGLLTLAVGLVLRWWARRGGATPPQWRWIAGCVTASVASHLYLDWQGSYGLRPLLPWSASWYYADWVAIVDPFFWTLPLLALAWGARRHWVPALSCALALLALVALPFWAGRDVVAPWVKAATAVGAGVCVVGWVRHWFGVAGRRRVAAYALVALAGYAGANASASVWVKARVHADAVGRFGPAAQWAALTVVGHPFRWTPIYASRDSVAGPGWAIARHLAHPAVRAALGTAPGRAVAQFARFLAADVDSGGGGMRVTLHDARFGTDGRPGFATAAITLR